MEAPKKLYISQRDDYSNERIFTAYPEREFKEDVEYVRTDHSEKVFLRIVDNFLSKIYSFCDITDENGYIRGASDLQAMFEDYYNAKKSYESTGENLSMGE